MTKYFARATRPVATLLKVAPALPGPKPVLRGALRYLERRYNALLRPSPQRVAAKTSLLGSETIQLRSGGLRVDSEASKLLKVASELPGPKPVRQSSPRDL